MATFLKRLSSMTKARVGRLQRGPSRGIRKAEDRDAIKALERLKFGTIKRDRKRGLI